jgi:hypothetical protein
LRHDELQPERHPRGILRQLPRLDQSRFARPLAAELAGHERVLIAISGEALYNVQVHLIFDVLDTVDEIADPATAARIATALAERWADAPARVAEAKKAAEFQSGMAVQMAARLMADLKAGSPDGPVR